MASSARIDELRKKFDENPRRYFAPLANEYRKAGDLEQAIFICEEYLPQQPGHMSGHIVYGQALFELGRHAEAQTVFETALSLDPENLIALRHLGDIARNAGDINAARVWYQRVLEADPRNEEIAQLMLSLLSSEGGVPQTQTSETYATTSSATFPEVSSISPTPMAVPIVDRAPERAAEEHTGTPSGGLEGEKSEDHTQLSVEPPMPPPLPSAPAASPTRDHELLDIEDFSFGGVGTPPSKAAVSETATFGPESEEDAEQAAVSEAGTPASGDEAAFNFGDEEGPFEADPFAIAATPPAVPTVPPVPTVPEANAQTWTPAGNEARADESLGFDAATADVGGAAEPPSPPVELAIDLELGLPADVSSEGAGSAELLDGLETFDAGLPPVGASEGSGGAPESAPVDGGHAGDEVPSGFGGALGEPVFDPFSLAAASSAMPEPTAQPVSDATAESTPEVPAEAFVTETMAELYLQQGHLESALDIYQKLVEQRPSDEALRERLQAVEMRVHETPAAPLTANEAATPAYVGPTIREFLSGILRSGQDDDIAVGNQDEGDAPEAGTAVTSATDEETDTGSSQAIGGDTEWMAIEVDEAFDAQEYGADSSEEHVTRDADTTSADTTSADTISEDTISTEGTARASEARPTPSVPSDTVSGSIDALFSGANADAADAAASKTLADAFAQEGSESAPLPGVPAHRADNELSLDHVFKTATPPRPNAPSANDAFSFDQFFAEEAADGGTTGSADTPDDSAQTDDDIAQFNAWLNGLKKT